MNASSDTSRLARPLALIKGAGDLASGVALRLRNAGFAVVMTEVAQPTAVRRSVAFAQAVYDGHAEVEGVRGVLAGDQEVARAVLEAGSIPIIVDPEATACAVMSPLLLVDAIMAKCNLGTRISDAPAVVALGPSFVAGRDAHAVIETKRGHYLGRVITEGQALPNSGVPGEVGGFAEERVIRAPCAGLFTGCLDIGAPVKQGGVIGYVGGIPVSSRLAGVLRGLLNSGVSVTPGFKLGDVDPRASREDCFLVSDKALAIGGGVLEAACALLGGVNFRLNRGGDAA
jgi:xanthine dehydrogenase accessory factor